MDNTSAEFEKFLLWFTNLEEIPVYTRRDFLAHVIEHGGIDEKAAKFIDDTLAHLEDNQKRQISELDRVKSTVQFFAAKAPEMEEQDIKNAEEEMQRIADKFCNEFRAAKQDENKKVEQIAQENDKMLTETLRSDI
jgi:DNA anti-recombination protein RmuC